MNRQKIYNNIAILILIGSISGLLILLLGPFQGGEHKIGLTDKEAHFFSFYILTIISLAVLQKIRKLDIAIGIIMFAVLSEVLQGLTGRDADLFDLLADSIGIVTAVLPLYLRNAFPKSDSERRKRSW